MNCKFCFTALLGVKRNLEAGEIVGQIAAVLCDQGVEPPLQRVNIVFMGMGEPFLNYDNFMKSVRLLVEGVGIPESRMTVSTAGIVPRIRDFGQEPVRPKLAISLNGSNDALRSEVMPLNRKWNLAELMKAAREFPLRTREKMTFEYVLIEGVNDAPEQAREVVELVRGMRARINLIALNPGTELPYRTPEQERVVAFRQILVDAGIPAFVRRPRGRDIFAACGQLKRTVEWRRLVNPNPHCHPERSEGPAVSCAQKEAGPSPSAPLRVRMTIQAVPRGNLPTNCRGPRPDWITAAEEPVTAFARIFNSIRKAG